MTSNTANFWAPRAWLALAVVAGTLASPLAQAQQVYRIVGPDGKVSFSDRPPAASSATAGVNAANAAAASSTASAGLPFELRQIAGKYPVTLYTSDNCAPCSSGRSLLTTRGVPFAEKTVSTANDNQALQRISGETSLPFVTIGSQQLKGFSDVEWTQFLNAAGYPPSSVLPASYRFPAATPLVAVTAAPAAAAPASDAAASSAAVQAPAARPVRPPANTNDNPSGIRF